MTVKAYGAHAGDQPLGPIDITRRETGPGDVRIDIAYCGVCHSDLHQVRAESCSSATDPGRSSPSTGFFEK
jgi:uncharacterized zinc-type alcohol dehydrogenase-like protein